MEEALRALSVRGIHWFDILDIIAVCVLFFFVLRQVRGTRAVQMIVGVFVLLVANVASGWFQLTATHRLLQNILFYVPFAIIVLFQESIRKFLASLGSLFFGRSASIAMSQEIASETAHACFALAELKHGALIIFERTQGPQELRGHGRGGRCGLEFRHPQDHFLPGNAAARRRCHRGREHDPGREVFSSHLFQPPPDPIRDTAQGRGGRDGGDGRRLRRRERRTGRGLRRGGRHHRARIDHRGTHLKALSPSWRKSQ